MDALLAAAPKIRADLQITPMGPDETTVRLEDATTGRSVSLSALEIDIVRRLDGTRSLQQLRQELRLIEDVDISEDVLLTLLRQLHRSGFVLDWPEEAAQAPHSMGETTLTTANPLLVARVDEAEQTLVEEDAAKAVALRARRTTQAASLNQAAMNLLLTVDVDDEEIDAMARQAVQTLMAGETDAAADILRNAAALAPKQTYLHDWSAALQDGAADAQASTESLWQRCVALAPQQAARLSSVQTQPDPQRLGTQPSDTVAQPPEFLATAAATRVVATGKPKRLRRTAQFILAACAVLMLAAGGYKWLAKPKLAGQYVTAQPHARLAMAQTIGTSLPQSVWLYMPQRGIVRQVRNSNASVAAGDWLATWTPPAQSAAKLRYLDAQMAADRRRLQALEKNNWGRRRPSAAIVRWRAKQTASLQARLAAGADQRTALLATISPAPQPLPAPFAGTVAEVRVSPGSKVQAGTPLLRFIDKRLLRLRLQGADVRGYIVGQTARVRLDAPQGKNAAPAEPSVLEGHVASIDTNDAGVATLSIDVRDATQKLADRPRGSFHLLQSGEPLALFVPSQALQKQKASTSIWLVDADDKLSRRRVSILDETADGAWVSFAGLGADRLRLVDDAAALAGDKLQAGHRVRFSPR